MAQTLVSLLVHVVFSTKNRANLITPDIEPDLYKYMSGTLGGMQSPCLKIGGTAKHVHLLVSQSKNLALAFMLEELKRVRRNGPRKMVPVFNRLSGRTAMAPSPSANPTWPH